jgi:hypothetical protein
MQLNLSKNLAPLKAAAIAKVDAEAEMARGQYITLGAGKAMVYMEKEKQAEAVSANPDINPNLAPLVAVDAELVPGSTLLDAATGILMMAQYWRAIAPGIERKQAQSKAAITAATTPAAIEAAATVAW